MTGAISPELIHSHGLTEEEYLQIKSILGREPNITELGVFSVMWSEHCSYKNTKLELRKFPTTGPSILVRAGEENAGVIDIGDGWAIAFKMESHNHPSAVEPFQGAATGVGGIIRDIFTMGARPVFLLNSLRFGPTEIRWLMYFVWEFYDTIRSLAEQPLEWVIPFFMLDPKPVGTVWLVLRSPRAILLTSRGKIGPPCR